MRSLLWNNQFRAFGVWLALLVPETWARGSSVLILLWILVYMCLQELVIVHGKQRETAPGLKEVKLLSAWSHP